MSEWTLAIDASDVRTYEPDDSSYMPLRRRRGSPLVLASLYALALALYLCSAASANPTQSDVFRSIQDNVKDSGDSSGLFAAVLCGAIGFILLLALLGKRQTRAQTSKPVNHPGKLLKEVRRRVPLSSGELKHVRIASEGIDRGDGTPVTGPLVLLLCPSVLGKVARNPGAAGVDPKVLARVARKLVRPTV